MLTDTHCHVLSGEYDNIDEILNNLKRDNLKRIIINGYDNKTNKEVLELVSRYDNVYGALGIHPDNIYDYNKESLEFIEKNLHNLKIVALGEIGLDYYHNEDNKKEQCSLFRDLLLLSEKYNKPVIVHSREATDDTLKVLKEFHLKGIIHCFSGSYETATEYIKLGYKLGINGILTFKNAKLPETLKKIAIKNILLETDSPYITPEPFRKNRNEPKYINSTFEKLLEIYDLGRDECYQELEANFLDIFDK